MKILVTGSSGLVGSQLIPFLNSQGHEVVPLIRNKNHGSDDIFWDPENEEIDFSSLNGFDAVVHLAGENIANKRWSPEQKQKIKNSRVKGTKFLCESLSKLNKPPKVLISASAIGFYGNRPNEVLHEHSDHGHEFLSSTCQEWEEATRDAKAAEIRVVHARFGVILSTRGGAMSKLLLPFQLGAGGIIGDGKQYMSWVDIEDVVGAIYHAIQDEQISGPMNVTAPNPVTNHEFTKTLGKVLFRPTIFPMPAFAARLAFGEMADALLMSSSFVEPRTLQDNGYKFQYPDIESSLRHLLGK